ncbi:Mur ligase family protein [Candidatus Omnitrophota bacterium]
MDDLKDSMRKDSKKFLAGVATVAIVGAGLSGVSCVRLAKRLGKKVLLSEVNKDIPREIVAELKNLGAELELGRHSKEFLQRAELIIVSPGVDTTGFRDAYLGSKPIPLVGEIEFAYWFCKSKDIIAITGTNGKTTTTFVIADILKQNTGRRVHVLGNIGEPFASGVSQIDRDDYVVLEISSFQLETIDTFRPHLGCLLNLAPDHLDRYPDMESYFQAKKRLFLNQDESDFAFFAASLAGRLADIKAAQRAVEAEDNISFIKQALAVYGIDPKAVDAYLTAFKGLSHRFEFVQTKRGVRFINDSKATNIASTIFALKKIDDPVILIAGGLDKGLDYSQILPFVKGIRRIVLIGQARQKIRDGLGEAVAMEDAHSLEEAVALAFGQAREGDTVLLSPMCASFDMFKNYKERGEVFKRAVRELI